MDFNQGELDFTSPASEHGYRKWQQELDQRKKEIEARFGIILGKPVIVRLSGEDTQLHGLITIISTTMPMKRSQLLLQIGKRQFTLAQVETITSP